MNEGIIILVGIAIVGVAYFVCAVMKHGTCDIGKVFTLMVVVIGLVTGIFLYAHAYTFLRQSFNEDAAWGAVAGFVLCLSSLLQIITMFRELLATKVDPTK
jgi:hypothetical protein